MRERAWARDRGHGCIEAVGWRLSIVGRRSEPGGCFGLSVCFGLGKVTTYCQGKVGRAFVMVFRDSLALAGPGTRAPACAGTVRLVSARDAVSRWLSASLSGKGNMDGARLSSWNLVLKRLFGSICKIVWRLGPLWKRFP